MTLQDLQSWSEIIKNFAVLAGAAAIFEWARKRKDRATDVLLQLETRFDNENIGDGCLDIEDEFRYAAIKPSLELAVRDRIENKGLDADTFKRLKSLDALLRFYVLLYGVLQARQVPEKSLSSCYRYWLTHCYKPERREFRAYIAAYYPTLKRWLRNDAERVLRAGFFTPEEFGWRMIQWGDED